MAPPLVAQYGPDVPHAIARMVAAVYPALAVDAFLHDALAGYEALGLMPRGLHIARALHRHLPADYAQALPLVLAAAQQPHGRDPGLSLAAFVYLPYTAYVGAYGLAHWALSMQALHALTPRFTAEFSIRPFLEQHPEATLEQLMHWTHDPNEHVRRLVSEGTRPRLPWAARLRAFQRDPQPVLALLERLKDDPALYVRRSVANNLNDIGKDHPALLASTAQSWLHQAPPQRRWIVQHALRSAIKRGEPGALAVLGFGTQAPVRIDAASVLPAQAVLGDTLEIAFDVTNTSAQAARVLVDCAVHFVKAKGASRPKVFKLSTLELAPGATQRVHKRIALVPLTTRTHYPGLHRVEALLNGQAQAVGSFVLAVA